MMEGRRGIVGERLGGGGGGIFTAKPCGQNRILLTPIPDQCPNYSVIPPSSKKRFFNTASGEV